MPLADLLLTPESLVRVTETFETIIRRSFATHPMRHTTQAEITRRFEICERWFRVMCRDHRFAYQRALDELPSALRTELDGGKFAPSTRQVWIPEDGLA